MPKKPKPETNHAPAPRYDRLRGGKRKAIQLLVDLDDHHAIREAAFESRLSIAQFVLAAALGAAKKILKDSSH